MSLKRTIQISQVSQLPKPAATSTSLTPFLSPGGPLVKAVLISVAEEAVVIITASLSTLQPLMHFLIGKRFAWRSDVTGISDNRLNAAAAKRGSSTRRIEEAPLDSVVAKHDSTCS